MENRINGANIVVRMLSGRDVDYLLECREKVLTALLASILLIPEVSIAYVDDSRRHSPTPHVTDQREGRNRNGS